MRIRKLRRGQLVALLVATFVSIVVIRHNRGFIHVTEAFSAPWTHGDSDRFSKEEMGFYEVISKPQPEKQSGSYSGSNPYLIKNSGEEGTPRKVVPEVLRPHITDLDELKGRHSDYITSRPCIEKTPHPNDEKNRQSGFIGPFRYLRNYKNPCWLPEGSERIQCVPYFYLIGTPKSGSTDIYKRMQSHPNVTTASIKEVKWFNTRRYHNSSFSDYMSLMNGAVDVIENNVDDLGYHGSVIGDGSTDLLMDNTFWPKYVGNEGCKEPRVTALSQLHHLWPRAKLILVLRNPVSRSYSSYFYHKNWRKTKFTGTAAQFDRWVRQSMALWNNCVQRRPFRHCLYSVHIYNTCLLMQFPYNFYSRYLLDLLKVFPREQVYITTMESYSANMKRTLRDIYKFLDLPPLSEDKLTEISRQNKSNTGANYKQEEQMWPSSRKLLEDYYAPYNEELWAILGEAFPRQW